MWKTKPIFQDQPASFQLFIFIFLLIFGAISGMLAGMGLILLLPGLDLSHLQNISSEMYLPAARIVQISSQLGLFIFPPLVWVLLFHHDKRQVLGWQAQFDMKMLYPAIILMFAALPLIHWLSEINHSIHFPESLASLEQWLVEKEAEAERLTTVFLSGKSLSTLLINLFMIALIPAVGEELVFRSVLQPLLCKLFKNVHVGIIAASLIFSLLHFQFFGLIPRFVLGLFLGYFYVWSGSIFVPMVMHFVNNGAAVVVFFLHNNGMIDIPMKDFGAVTNQYYLILSITATILLMLAGKYFALKSSNKKIA